MRRSDGRMVMFLLKDIVIPLIVSVVKLYHNLHGISEIEGVGKMPEVPILSAASSHSAVLVFVALYSFLHGSTSLFKIRTNCPHSLKIQVRFQKKRLNFIKFLYYVTIFIFELKHIIGGKTDVPLLDSLLIRLIMHLIPAQYKKGKDLLPIVHFLFAVGGFVFGIFSCVWRLCKSGQTDGSTRGWSKSPPLLSATSCIGNIV